MDYEQQIIDTAVDIITPVMEQSIVIAGQYAKACERTMITSMDITYAMCYAARNVVGRSLGSMFPDSGSESDSDSDADSVEEVDDEDNFTRYTGGVQLMNDVNHAYDTWDAWEPYSPIEKMLKNAVDAQKN